MSPDSPQVPKGHRVAWRIMSAVGCLLASVSILLSVVLFARQKQNRVNTLTYTCRQIERVKTDGRNILLARGVDRLSLPRHRDGSYAFDPIGEDCHARAVRVVGEE